MSKLSKEEQARFSGAVWLLEYAKKHGLAEAEKEVERRGIRQMPLKLNNADVDVFVSTERDNISKCMLVDTISTLHDEFGFEREQCEQFVKRWNNKISCVADGYINWRELRDSVYEELGIWIPLSKELENEDEGNKT